MTEGLASAAAVPAGGHVHHIVTCDFSAMELAGGHEGALCDLQRLQGHRLGDRSELLAVIGPEPGEGAGRRLQAERDGGLIFRLEGSRLLTQGVLGFIGTGETCLEIRSQLSRARGGEGSGGDGLLCYLLERCVGLRLHDLSVPGVYFTAAGHCEVLAVLGFVHQLLAAVRRGLPRRYRLHRCNDMRLRGRLDVSCHLRLNLPFTGRCACTAWEYDADHEGVQLVRQALEHLWRRPAAGRMLELLCADPGISAALRRLRACRPSAPPRRPDERPRPAPLPAGGLLHHPWHELQDMSAMVLRGLAAEFTACGRQESYGLLLRGSRLWESCLGQVLAGLGFTHGRPQCRESGLEVYAAAAGPETVPGGSRIFPDFYVSGRVVIDAKYKHLTPRPLPSGAAPAAGHDRGCLTAADRHQIVAYMYAMGLGAGAHGGPDLPLGRTLH